MKQRELSLFVLLVSVFVAALVTANVVAGKIMDLWGVFVPAGVLAYSITFAITDTLTEIWGRERARLLVNSRFAVLILVWGLITLALILPAAPFWHGQEAFGLVLDGTNRMILGSIVAYGISQTVNVWLFHKIKQLSASRHLWLRDNASTLLSRTLDTCVFVTIAFYGQFPVLPLIMGQLAVKHVIALLGYPHRIRAGLPGAAALEHPPLPGAGWHPAGWHPAGWDTAGWDTAGWDTAGWHPADWPRHRPEFFSRQERSHENH